jgi:hypothetical protein
MPMTGAPVVAAWIAQVVFWAVLAVGFLTDSLSLRAASIFCALWLLGFSVIPRLAVSGGQFTAPYMAVLDVALVLVVVKGDVRLS